MHAGSAFMLRDPTTSRLQNKPEYLLPGGTSRQREELSDSITRHIAEQYNDNGGSGIFDAWLDELTSLPPLPEQEQASIDDNFVKALSVLQWPGA